MVLRTLAVLLLAGCASAPSGASTANEEPETEEGWRRIRVGPSRPPYLSDVLAPFERASGGGVRDVWMAACETTVEEFEAFCAETGRSMPEQPPGSTGRHPVVNVSWHEATAYCDWVGGTLPTMEEWVDALGLRQADSSEHWGAVRGLLIVDEPNGESIREVASDSRDCSADGLRDLCSNADEWLLNSPAVDDPTFESWRDLLLEEGASAPGGEGADEERALAEGVKAFALVGSPGARTAGLTLHVDFRWWSFRKKVERHPERGFRVCRRPERKAEPRPPGLRPGTQAPGASSRAGSRSTHRDAWDAPFAKVKSGDPVEEEEGIRGFETPGGGDSDRAEYLRQRFVEGDGVDRLAVMRILEGTPVSGPEFEPVLVEALRDGSCSGRASELAVHHARTSDAFRESLWREVHSRNPVAVRSGLILLHRTRRVNWSEMVPLLEELLVHDDEGVRATVADILQHVDNLPPELRRKLAVRVAEDPVELVVDGCCACLTDCERLEPEVIGALLRGLEPPHASDFRRMRILMVLETSGNGPQEAAGRILELARVGSMQVRMRALEVLESAHSFKASELEILEELRRDPDPGIREAAGRCLEGASGKR